MNDLQIERLSEQMLRLAANLKIEGEVPIDKCFMGFRAGETLVNLVDLDWQHFQDLLSRLYRDSGWSDKHSEDYVSEIIKGILGKLYHDRRPQVAVESLKEEVRKYGAYRDEHDAFVPLVGLTMNVADFKVGQVVLTQWTEAQATERLGLNLRTTFGQFVLKSLVGTPMAVFRTVAEPKRAIERGLDEARRAVEVLRFGIALRHPNQGEPFTTNVAVVGDVPDAVFQPIVLPVRNALSISISRSNWGPTIPFRVDLETVRALNESPFGILSRILEKSLQRLTSFEQAILRGLHWFGNALCQKEAENELLCHVICLEALLTPRNREPISNAVAEGVALLLKTTYDERKQLKKRVRELYGYRSGVSHGGSKSVLTTDIYELREITRDVIGVAANLSQKVDSQERLLELIEEIKLGKSQAAKSEIG
jgi:hypothetical protein